MSELMWPIIENMNDQMAIMAEMIKNLESRIGLNDRSIEDLYEIKKTKRKYTDEF